MKPNKCLYEFYWDCGRMGYIESYFLATDEQIEELIGSEVYFGEVLGKHSEVYGTVEDPDVKLISTDEVFIQMFEETIGHTGYNPLEYLNE